MSVPNFNFLVCIEVARLVRLARLARIVRLQGVSKKGGFVYLLFISIKLNRNLLGIYSILKVGYIAPSAVQKNFCTISGS